MPSCGRALGAPFTPRGMGGADSSLPLHSPDLREAGVGASGGLSGRSQRTDLAPSAQNPALPLRKWPVRPSRCSGLKLEVTGYFFFPTSNHWSGNPVSSTFKIHPESNQVPPLLPHVDSKHPPLVSLPRLHSSLSILHTQPKGPLCSNPPWLPGKSTSLICLTGAAGPRLIWPHCLSDLSQLCHPLSLAHLAPATPASCGSSNTPGRIQPQGLCTYCCLCLERSAPSSFNSWISHFILISSQGHCLREPFPGYPAKVSPLLSPLAL